MRWVTKNDLAALTGSTWRTVKKRLETAGMEPNEHDCYDSEKALRVVLEIDNDTDSLSAERARLARAQAEKYEMENAVRRGELCVVAEAEKRWADQVLIVRSSLLAMPAGLAPLLEHRTATEAEAILKEAIDDALREFASRADAVGPGGGPNLETMEPAASAYPQ